MLSMLRPVDGNSRSPSTGQGAESPRTRAIGAIARISSITEDGDENLPVSWRRKNKSPQSDHARDLSKEHRLSNLLEGTPASRALQSKVATNVCAVTPNCGLQSSVRGSSMTTGSELEATPVILPATSNFLRGSPKPTMRESSCDKLQQQSEYLGQLEALPDDEPYRARPPQRLGLEHFKINPEYNNGLDYAYDTVIRKRDERKCASGCTRPGCCGEKFSAMVRFGIPADASGRAMCDREILGEFLGEDKNVDMLSSEARDNLLVEAKARVFANRFGKHRHQHHRPGTPPGFWRTEMPGTQEIEEDREGAHRLEREKVQERYREALRPGGLWKFAD
ncbi:DNA repair protein endonuclease SAE2/CtIP C-terminus-domain-containing protein, partial [Aspergillus multicolor]|uniref:SAE2 C-terminal domain-containing protein n=1 Tax=Aspergillus multicolor TaxID=41759 RepID=UPI003CCE23A8